MSTPLVGTAVGAMAMPVVERFAVIDRRSTAWARRGSPVH